MTCLTKNALARKNINRKTTSAMVSEFRFFMKIKKNTGPPIVILYYTFVLCDKHNINM